MNATIEWIVRAFSEGLSAEERRKFAAVLWRLTTLCCFLWIFGLLGSSSGFATKSDADAKIAEALRPIAEDIRKMRQELERSNDQQRRLLIEAVITRIRDLQKVCMATQPDTPARSRMVIMLDDAQIEYKTLAGERYPLNPQCE